MDHDETADTSAAGPSGLLGRLRRRRGQEPPPTATGDHTATDTAVDSAPVADLDDGSFEAGTEGGWTVVDFWAPWCAPCRAFHPVFDRVAAATEHVRFARCNVDESPGAAGVVGIQSIPTVVLFDPDGNEVHRLVGVPSPPAFAALLRLATTPN